MSDPAKPDHPTKADFEAMQAQMRYTMPEGEEYEAMSRWVQEEAARNPAFKKALEAPDE